MLFLVQFKAIPSDDLDYVLFFYGFWVNQVFCLSVFKDSYGRLFVLCRIWERLQNGYNITERCSYGL
jgi:hypothetical protein